MKDQAHYRDGRTMEIGDAILFDNGVFPGRICDFFYSGDELAGVGYEMHRGRALCRIEKFDSLQLVERNSADHMAAGVAWLTRRGEEGDAQSQFAIGNLFAVGLGVKSNKLLARNWWLKAAAQEHAEAMLHLAPMYLDGEVLGEDPGQCAALIRRAAELGLAAAQSSYAGLLDEGELVERDLKQAIGWLLKAIAQGDTEAMVRLGLHYMKGTGVAKDLAKSVTWYRKAAGMGNADGQYFLGCAYDLGRGVEQNDAESVRWYQAASDRGHLVAMCNLADKYEHGRGIEQNEAQALSCYLKSAEGNVTAAMFSLGMMHWEGRGTKQSNMLALQWFQRAANHGHPEAARMIAEVKASITRLG